MASMEGTTYLHDLSKNRFNVEFELSMRIIRGLSVFANSEYQLLTTNCHFLQEVSLIKKPSLILVSKLLPIRIV